MVTRLKIRKGCQLHSRSNEVIASLLPDLSGHAIQEGFKLGEKSFLLALVAVFDGHSIGHILEEFTAAGSDLCDQTKGIVQMLQIRGLTHLGANHSITHSEGGQEASTARI